MHRFFVFFGLFFGIFSVALAQDSGLGVIRGYVYEQGSGDGLPMVDVGVVGTGLYALSDTAGFFELRGVPVGFQSVEFGSFGYKGFVTEPVRVTVARPVVLEVLLTPEVRSLGAVKVRARSVRRAVNPPIGIKRLTIEQIETSPGGNRDISKVVQSLPGVAATSVDRNDIIVRGGGPMENRFFLDGIELPVLNHFQTQGSSGGNVSIINSDLLSGATLYTSAFPVPYGGALSSVLDMEFRAGNTEKFGVRGVVGASDVGLTIDTPLGGKSTLIASYRMSYLQFLFQALNLPFLPTYQDFQFKFQHTFDKRNRLKIIGLGAYDINRLNTTMGDLDVAGEQILNYLPENDQWSYVVGAVYTHYLENGTLDAVLSHNQLDNSFSKFRDNDKSGLQTLDYNSRESEIRMRVGYNGQLGDGYVLNVGATVDVGWFDATQRQLIYLPDAEVWDNYTADLWLWSYAVFGGINKRFLDDKLRVMASVRLDWNSYNAKMGNPLRQFSPRVALGYDFSRAWEISANIGRYYQEPAYTTMGYRGEGGVRQNLERLTYIGSNQLTIGGAWKVGGKTTQRLGLETFVKLYDHYPMSLIDSTAVGSANGQFVVGGVPASSVGKGRAWGVELSYQNQDLWGFRLSTSYTYVNSKYARLDADFMPTNQYVPTSWDYQHIFNIVLGRKFGKGWEAGLRWRYCGGAPYTPYDVEQSSDIGNWQTNLRPVLDFSLNNTQRLPDFHQLDIRVDKNWYFRKWTLGLYLDIQNVYNYASLGQDLLLPAQDLDGNYIEDPQKPGHYQMQEYENKLGGSIIPTFGLVVEF